jgi:tRNA-splicing ligase RtcB
LRTLLGSSRAGEGVVRHRALIRLDDNTLEVQNPQGVPVRLYANAEVQIENSAIDELLAFLQVQDDLHGTGQLEQVVITPDFHKGRGIPIGTVALLSGVVLPQAIGNDVGCGVSALATDLAAQDLTSLWPQLRSRLRYLFFEGGRDIPMSPRQREALLLRGPAGLLDTYADNEGQGLWKYYYPEQQAKDAELYCGPAAVNTTFSFSEFITGSGGQSSRDAQIGSVGGGNHFVEIQQVEQILQGTRAYAWGLKSGYCTIMVHSGSVSLGHAVGSHFVDQAKALWPKGAAKPKSGFYALAGDLAEQYLRAEINAINFAAGNRLFLGLMVIRALSEVLGRKVSHRLVYDAAHNWIDATYGLALHRKGSCPAFAGDPVLIPGSMGDSSYVLEGLGNQVAQQSACHGAGRQMSRGKAMKVGPQEVLRVVTAVDPESLQIRGRQDILKKYRQRLAEESPGAYKPVGPVIQTIQGAKVAEPVVRLKPLLTVKG